MMPERCPFYGKRQGKHVCHASVPEGEEITLAWVIEHGCTTDRFARCEEYVQRIQLLQLGLPLCCPHHDERTWTCKLTGEACDIGKLRLNEDCYLLCPVFSKWFWEHRARGGAR